MSTTGNLSLPELAIRYHIKDIFGAFIAYFTSQEGGFYDLRSVSDRISCYEFQLIRSGVAHICIGELDIDLHPGDLLELTPYQSADCAFPPDVETEGLLIESHFYESLLNMGADSDILMTNMPTHLNNIYHLDAEKASEISGIFQQIRKSISYVHIYKVEMIRALVHLFMLNLSELPFDRNLVTHDFKHKENILKIFFFLANRNFKKEHQIQFYANKMNITTTYLSRIVKEVTGNSINRHLTNLIYEEACNLLMTSDMTIGEIADDLGFPNQSAFTNFFKLHAKCSPKDYRKK